MDTNVSFSICTLFSWTLWTTGAVLFVLISLGAIPHQCSGVAFLTFTTGSLLYVRRCVHSGRERDRAAYELGRLSVEGGKVRHLS